MCKWGFNQFDENGLFDQKKKFYNKFVEKERFFKVSSKKKIEFC